MSSSILTALEALEDHVDAALADDPAGLPGPVLADALEREVRIRNKFAALDARLTGAFDASKEWMGNGARSVGAWLVTAGRERRTTVDRRVARGRSLRAMPVTWAAFAAGRINTDHVDTLVTARAGREEVFAVDEALLVGYAVDKRYVAFRQRVRYWCDQVDPDGTDERAHQQLDDNEWHASKSFEEETFVNGRLDPVGGSIYRRELDRLTDWLFEQEWAEATARLGEGNVTVRDLARTLPQRRAAAQVVMAERSAAMSLGVAGTATRTVLNVSMDWATFCAELARKQGRTDVNFPGERTCRLDDGTIIAPSTALSLGLAGEIRGIVLDPDGAPLHFGQSRRGFTGDLRTAVQLTHDWCGHDAGCDVPSWRCQIDHIEPFADGGPTAAENGDPKCGPHNRWKERLDAEIRRRQRWRREHLDARGDPKTDADPSAERDEHLHERDEPDTGERAA